MSQFFYGSISKVFVWNFMKVTGDLRLLLHHGNLKCCDWYLAKLFSSTSLQPEYIYYSVFTAGNTLWCRGSSLVNNPLFSFWCPEADLKIEINRQRNFHPIALAARVFQAKSKTFLWSLRFLSAKLCLVLHS